MENDFLIYLCALQKLFATRCGVGRKVMGIFPNLADFFALDSSALARLGFDGETAARIRDKRNLEWAENEVAWAAAYGIRLLSLGGPEYPYRLAECPDAPLMLYCKGDADLNPDRSLAVVGTRRATFHGKEGCRKILEHTSLNNVKPLIVSGLALGIDGTAHYAALEFGLPTVAVLPTGLDEIYPSRHRDLAKKIVESGGALVTDFPRRTLPERYTFLKRNRIIAGMADAVLLAESFAPGGGLITASLASSYGREVFAVPGRMGDESFVGCNKLISENVASIVFNANTIEKEMGWTAISGKLAEPELFPKELSETGKKIIAKMRDKSPLTLEELVSGTGSSMTEIMSELVSLEIDGRIRKERQFYYLCT